MIPVFVPGCRSCRYVDGFRFQHMTLLFSGNAYFCVLILANERPDENDMFLFSSLKVRV